MKTYILNLVYPERSHIKYDLISFPDSQQLITLKDFSKIENPFECKVIIKSRLNWKDLQLIILAQAALRNLGIVNIELYIPYLLGARSDRAFSENGINYLRDCICPIINFLGFSKVIVTDPHSNCTETALKNFSKKSNSEIVKWALEQIMEKSPKLVWLIPDKGAAEKARQTIVEVNFQNPIVYCDKDRDVHTGTILKTKVETPDFEGDDIVIVDDICDGGRTFIEIVKRSKILGCGKAYLIVTHGIFSQGFSELSEYFEEIYCTNSIADFVGEKEKPWIKQLNIFE